MSARFKLSKVDQGYYRIALDGRDIGRVQRHDGSGFWRARYAWRVGGEHVVRSATTRDAAVRALLVAVGK